MLIVYARTRTSPFHAWAVEQIAEAVSSEGASLSVISVAELCAEDDVDPASVTAAIQRFGIQIADIPANCAQSCGRAYQKYRDNRKSSGDKNAPRVPLPDFFIGAYAEMSGFDLVTNDTDRFRIYFPSVRLITPRSGY